MSLVRACGVPSANLGAWKLCILFPLRDCKILVAAAVWFVAAVSRSAGQIVCVQTRSLHPSCIQPTCRNGIQILCHCRYII